MVYEEHHKAREGGEIVIKISPRNLERLIYILIIIGLIIFSVVQFNKKSVDCSIVENTTTEEVNTTSNASGAVVADTKDEEEDVQEEPETIEPEKKLSGKVEFELVSASACIINEDLGQGRLKNIKVKIDNGLKKSIDVKIDLYVWNDDESLDEIEDYTTSVENIFTIPSGVAYNPPYSIKYGIFRDIGEDKKVKAVLKYADGSEITEIEIIEDTVSDVEVKGDC